jgi:branched-subunit amino acid transport protein
MTIDAPALEIWTAILVLTAVVIAIRNVFLVAPRDWLPRGTFERALRYAPLAALVALVAPELTQPVLRAPGLSLWGLTDPRVLSALAVVLVSRWSGNSLAALASGVGVFVLLLNR